MVKAGSGDEREIGFTTSSDDTGMITKSAHDPRLPRVLPAHADESGGATSSRARRSAATPSHAMVAAATSISPPPSR